MQQRIVEFAISLQRPVGSAQFLNLFGGVGCGPSGRVNRQICVTLFAIEFELYVFVISVVIV